MGSSLSCKRRIEPLLAEISQNEPSAVEKQTPGRHFLTPRTILKNKEILSSFVPHSVLRKFLKHSTQTKCECREFYGAGLFAHLL